MSVSRWGWNPYFEAMWREGNTDNAVPARVVSQQRKFWRVVGEFGDCLAEASGKLRLAADEGADWPAVGDWVSLEPQEGNTTAMIRAVLPRRSRFIRKSPGKRIEEQVIAANVDTALMVSALDDDFNPRRVERYLAQCWESGARPVLILNKADACQDSRGQLAEIERMVIGAPVCAISAKTGEGMDKIEPFLVAGQTLVLLGSSGVGKSTLANRLLGQSLQKVSDVRAGDSRGQHTTTVRKLFALPGGALLIDTPGLRELQLWDAEDGVAQAFTDIDLLAAQCRFGDCGHKSEPGCAVQLALSAGTLDLARLENHRKLMREQAFLRRKMDPEARSEEKRRIRRLTNEGREIYRQKKPL
ncbi:MAG: ribosome small subunit-dependent GTPase A [Candidatus Acidiferrales bacterium]